MTEGPSGFFAQINSAQNDGVRGVDRVPVLTEKFHKENCSLAALEFRFGNAN